MPDLGLGSPVDPPDDLDWAGDDAGYWALRWTAASVELARDVIRVAGADATTFLQGQLSQDVAALPAGGSAWSWLLQPNGKVDALIRVGRVGPDELLIDTDAGWGERVTARLNRFKLRTKVDLEALDGWRVLGLRGPALPAVGTGGDGVVLAVDGSWPGLPGVDLIGPDPRPPADLRAAGGQAWEAARIEAGIPVMGAELSERTIPAETGLIERTVSFTKGCYTGQELVARIDSRGSNVPRHMVGLHLGGPTPAGAVLRDAEGAEVGVVTSAAPSPRLGWVGLGYVRRGQQPGASLRASGEDGQPSTAVIGALPLVEVV